MNIQLEKENYYTLNWLDLYLIGHKGFICGGCFKHIFAKEKIKDLDIFFRNETDWSDAVQYFDERTVGYGFDGEALTPETAEYYFFYENDKVKAYKNIKTGIVIELCRAIFGEPEEIINSFDFTITKFAYYKEEVPDEDGNGVHLETRILCNENFFEHLYLKRLVIDDRIDYPMSTFERTYRYARYGYFPCKETKLKLALALNELSSEEVQVTKSLYDGID